MLWKELITGMENPAAFKRTLKALEWMSEGFEVVLKDKTFALSDSTHADGSPVLVMKLESSLGNHKVVGLDLDVRYLYSVVRNASEEDWVAMSAGIVLTKVKREPYENRG